MPGPVTKTSIRQRIMIILGAAQRHLPTLMRFGLGDPVTENPLSRSRERLVRCPHKATQTRQKEGFCSYLIVSRRSTCCGYRRLKVLSELHMP
jgi:hypothetical protein